MAEQKRSCSYKKCVYPLAMQDTRELLRLTLPRLIVLFVLQHTVLIAQWLLYFKYSSDGAIKVSACILPGYIFPLRLHRR